MQYEKILRLALVPTILFFLLALASVALTTHYWILGDWIVPRGIRIVTDNYNQRTQRYSTDYTIVFFIDRETDATIASGCLCLVAAVMALIAWSTLRKPGMDTQLKAVSDLHTHSLLVAEQIAGQTSLLGTCRHRREYRRGRFSSRITCAALHRTRQRPIRLQV